MGHVGSNLIEETSLFMVESEQVTFVDFSPIQKNRTTFAGRDPVGQQKSARICFPCFEFEMHTEVLKGWILEYFKNPSDKPSYEKAWYFWKMEGKYQN